MAWPHQCSAPMTTAVFMQMGMTALFDRAEADLGGISRQEGLFVSCATHKAAIDVNEEGTTATAATGRAAPPPLLVRPWRK